MVGNMETEQVAEHLIQTGVYLTHTQKRRLKLVAAEKDTNASEIVREALDEWMDRHTG